LFLRRLDEWGEFGALGRQGATRDMLSGDFQFFADSPGKRLHRVDERLGVDSICCRPV
jgi:hypothetical protein